MKPPAPATTTSSLFSLMLSSPQVIDETASKKRTF